MSFEDDWARHVANAKAKRSTGMQLNSSGASGKQKLNVTPELLRARAEKAENDAAPEFRRAHAHALGKTADVAGSLKGLSCDEAITDFVDSWKKGVRYVTGRIGNDGAAKALRSAASSFTEEEKERKRSFDYKPGDVV